MSSVASTKTYIFNSELGNVLVKVDSVEEFDIEDIIKNKAIAQALRVKFVNLGKKVNINQTKTIRTIPSTYMGTQEELS